MERRTCGLTVDCLMVKLRQLEGRPFLKVLRPPEGKDLVGGGSPPSSNSRLLFLPVWSCPRPLSMLFFKKRPVGGCFFDGGPAAVYGEGDCGPCEASPSENQVSRPFLVPSWCVGGFGLGAVGLPRKGRSETFLTGNLFLVPSFSLLSAPYPLLRIK